MSAPRNRSPYFAGRGIKKRCPGSFFSVAVTPEVREQHAARCPKCGGLIALGRLGGAGVAALPGHYEVAK